MKTKWQVEAKSNRKFWGKVIAIYQEEIVAVGNSDEEVKEIMKNQGFSSREYSLFKVPKDTNMLRILTFKLRSLRTELWEPLYPVYFKLPNDEMEKREMLIDSGADISVVGYSFGQRLGFITNQHDVQQAAAGIGGNIVNYILKKSAIEIDGYLFENHFAWLQNEDMEEMIIGREIVFDLFDIEFKQADENILFKRRPIAQ